MSSLIQQLRTQNEKLIVENHRLTKLQKQTEQDIHLISVTTKEAWDSLGLDFSKMGSSENSKPSLLEITKISLGLGKKLISGRISVTDLIKKWEGVQPTLAKYEHLFPKSEIKK